MKFPSDVAFVLLHGSNTGAWIWDELLPRLQSDAVAPDFPGHGRRNEDLRQLRLADCIRDAASRLPDHRRLILVGHSFGAAVAVALAERHPERVAHVVAVAGTIPLPQQSLNSALPFPMAWLGQAFLRCAGRTFEAAPDLMLRGLPPARRSACAARFRHESVALHEEPFAWSGQLGCPATYVSCRRDPGPLRPAWQRRMAARLAPAARGLELDTGHFPMLEQPAALAEILNDLAGRARQSLRRPRLAAA